MSWELKREEFDAVIRLAPNERFEHLVKRCAEHENIWCLRDDQGWVTSADDEGRTFLPVWPHPTYAAACAEEGWLGSEPESIDIYEWVADWLPGMEADNLTVLAFPVPPENLGIPVPPARMAGALQRELEQYE